MNWVELHRVLIGIAADSLTFLGGAILTRDAFLRLKELNRSRIDARFREEFPRLNLTDDEMKAAVVSLRWTLAGLFLMAVGFLTQLLLRVIDWQSG
jgi:hypothetical protein